MSQTIRAFLAFDLSQPVKETLADIQKQLHVAEHKIKWVNPEQMHLTIKFFGGLNIKKIAPLTAVINDMTKTCDPFILELDTLGAFPSMHNPNVLWVSLNDQKNQLSDFVAQIENTAAKVGLPKETRVFKPHITLGRVKSIQNIEQLKIGMKEIKIPEETEQAFESLTFYQSTLNSNGPIYTTLERFPFKAKAT